LYRASRASSDLYARLAASAPVGWTAAERQTLLPMLTQTHGSMELVVAKLAEIIDALRRSDVG
jgi:hypothetical protein